MYAYIYLYIYIYIKEGSQSVRDYERCGRSEKINRSDLIGQRFRVTMLRF